MALEGCHWIDEQFRDFILRLEGKQRETRADFLDWYERLDRESLALLTPSQRAQYDDWFGPFFVFDDPTWKSLRMLPNPSTEKR